MAMVEMAMAMAMENETAKDPLSNHSTASSRRWLHFFTNSTFQMMMMIINLHMKRKEPLTIPMLL
jgi:hypothetical protein